MNNHKVNLWARYTTLFVISLIVLFVYFMSEKTEYDPSIVYLETGWTISDSLEYKEANLSDLVFSQVKRGDEIILSNVVPEFDIDSPALIIYTIHSALKVEIDGEQIYEYGTERYSQNKLMGYGYFAIPFLKDYIGKTITITMLVSEDNAFTDIHTPYICNGLNFAKDLAIKKFYPLCINISLMVMGILVFCISIVFGLKNQTFVKLACIGGFSFLISIWSLCNYDLIYIFTYDPLVKAYTEFSTLYTCTIPLILFFWNDIKEKRKNGIAVMYYILLSAQVLFTLFSFVSEATGLYSFPKLLIIEHALFIALALFMIITVAIDFMNKTYNHVALAFGIALLLVVGLADIIRFDLQKYVAAFQGDDYTSLACVGTFGFVICQLVDFYKGLNRDMMQLAKTEIYEKMAYLDELTGLYNRRKSEEEMDAIDASKIECGIFSFDLNNLKTVNDTYGHSKGDEMLKIFAEVLKETFEDKATLIRSGGDEFIAIIREPDENTRRYYSSKINDLLTEKSKDFVLPITVAIGYSNSSDSRNEDTKETFRRADARMYKQKARMKEDK